MARTFTNPFLTQSIQPHSRPYLILQIDWFDGNDDDGKRTRYYLDRPANSFKATGTRIPASNISSALVVDWGQVHLTLREQQIGSVDELTIKLEDRDGELRDELTGYVQQREVVTIWRLFDHSTTVWPTDAGKIFVGVMRPFTWNEADNTISIPVEDLSKRLLRTVECRATKAIFPYVDPDHQDRNIPLCWGRAHRVEAVLVHRPWQTKLLEPVPKTLTPPFTLKVEDHPSEIGADSGAFDTTGSGDAKDCWLGSDLVHGYFTQSPNLDTTPSTFTVTAIQSTTKATATIIAAFDFGVNRYGVISGGSVSPASLNTALDSIVGVGTPVDILIDGVWQSDTIDAFAANTPAEGYYQIKLTTFNSSLNFGQAIKFKTDTAQQRQFPAGAILRPKEGNWIYACNALPSKAVVRVEGFGDAIDDAGQKLQDFMLLGGRIADSVSGTLEITDANVDPYTINLNDDTWEDDLGRRLTTITFKSSPRNIEPALADNRLWVTLDGVETSGTGGETPGSQVITNPAAVISEYLEHPNLMNVATGYINSSSFTLAATGLADRYVGFAQVESMDGLEWLQDIARQCRSVLFFDQGKVSMKVLSNTPSGAVITLNQHEILERTLQVEEQPVQDLISRLTGKWQRSWDDKTGQKKRTVLGLEPEVESQFGMNNRDQEYWLYNRREHVETEVQFWLTRWSTLKRIARFTALPHKALRLQPGDWIKLSYLLHQYAYFTDSRQFEAHLGTPSLTDLRIHASNDFLVKSDSYLFQPMDQYRVLTIASGAGFVPGDYSIVQVEDGYAVLDGPAGTAGATGGSGSLNDVTRWVVFSRLMQYDFAPSDVGRHLQVISGVNWVKGVYTILGYGFIDVEGIMRHVAFFFNSLTAGEQPGPDGTVAIGNGFLYENQDCEVLEVKDTGPKGLLDVVVRHDQPYTSI